jgi:DNA-binding NarL/FixJ family response regulator
VTTVLIADDQDLVRSGLRLMLELADIDIVGEARDGAQAVEQAGRLRPDVIVMDIRMPGMDGIEATRRIVADGLPSRVLILTTFDLDEHVFDALAAGASAFLLKDVGRDKLVDAVRTVAAGDELFAPSVLRRLVQHYVTRPPAPAQRTAELDQLTPREVEILCLVGGGLSNSEIADQLVISLPTVKTHLRHILHKLQLRDRAQAVVAAYRFGLIQT